MRSGEEEFPDKQRGGIPWREKARTFYRSVKCKEFRSRNLQHAEFTKDTGVKEVEGRRIINKLRSGVFESQIYFSVKKNFYARVGLCDRIISTFLRRCPECEQQRYATWVVRQVFDSHLSKVPYL